MSLFSKLYFESMEWEPATRDWIITFRKEPGWFGRKFGATTRRLQYIGDCTVWYTFPDFHRCGILTESWLSDIWEREKYRKKKAGAAS